VHQFIDIPVTTPGLADFPAPGSRSIMVATGLGKVALIQTGLVDDKRLDPTQHFDQPGIVRVFENDDVRSLKPIISATTSNIPLGVGIEQGGWLFVGGYGGCAVLRDPVTGEGWSTAADGGIKTLSDEANFKTIGSFLRVRSLVAEYAQRDTMTAPQGVLYVMTNASLHRFVMNADKFRDENPAPLDLVSLEPPVGHTLISFIIVDDVGVLGTDKGLFWKSLDEPASAWHEVRTQNNASLGPVVHINVRPSGVPGVGANLYVLAADVVRDSAAIFRCDVDNDYGVRLFNEALSATESERENYVELGEVRGSVLSDGAHLFTVLSKHLDRPNFVSVMPQQQLSRHSIRLFERQVLISIDLTKSYRIGNFTRNSATGANLVGGDWGLRIQE
jgi:hypothetical protein